MDDYTGIKYIAFYGESIASGGDNDFFVDNVMIRQTPAGAPDHVTLVSPANGATYIDPENAEINWTPAITGGNPAYYEVLVGENPFNPEEGYFGEYSFETENTSLNLSEQDIILPFSSTWYWAVLPYNADGLCPDPLAPEFMVWSFTIAPDPTIISLPYEEYFDGVTCFARRDGMPILIQLPLLLMFALTVVLLMPKARLIVFNYPIAQILMLI